MSAKKPKAAPPAAPCDPDRAILLKADAIRTKQLEERREACIKALNAVLEKHGFVLGTSWDVEPPKSPLPALIPRPPK